MCDSNNNICATRAISVRYDYRACMLICSAAAVPYDMLRHHQLACALMCAQQRTASCSATAQTVLYIKLDLNVVLMRSCAVNALQLAHNCDQTHRFAAVHKSAMGW